MSLIRYTPIRDLVSFPTDVMNMQREINKIFGDLFHGDMQNDGSLFPSFLTPAVDVVEHDDKYVVKVELPGVAKDDVKITMRDNILTIRGEKKQEDHAKESGFQRVERSYGSFQRSFILPTTVRNDGVDATYRDGILTITLPKAEEARPKQIEVRVK